jgi:hypothetical protein
MTKLYLSIISLALIIGLVACGGTTEAGKEPDRDGTVTEISYQEGKHSQEYTVVYEETTGCYALILGSTWTSDVGSVTVLKCDKEE